MVVAASLCCNSSHQLLAVPDPRVLELGIGEMRTVFRKDPSLKWIGLGPNDASGSCECPQCHALDGGDWDPFSNEVSVTDRYVWFFN